jgi:hypothetical protein
VNVHVTVTVPPPNPVLIRNAMEADPAASVSTVFVSGEGLMNVPAVDVIVYVRLTFCATGEIVATLVPSNPNVKITCGAGLGVQFRT